VGGLWSKKGIKVQPGGDGRIRTRHTQLGDCIEKIKPETKGAKLPVRKAKERGGVGVETTPFQELRRKPGRAMADNCGEGDAGCVPGEEKDS